MKERPIIIVLPADKRAVLWYGLERVLPVFREPRASVGTELRPELSSSRARISVD